MSQRTFGPEATRAAFPLGGIGTGNVSLGSRGELRDWELANRPGKGRRNPFSFFAIRTVAADGTSVARVLEARLQPPHDADQGHRPEEVAGLPRLAGSRLRGHYPLAEIEFDDPALPVGVALTAFTPFVPLDVADSGIPCAVLRYRVRNPGPSAVTVTIAGSVGNPVAVAHQPDLYRDHLVEAPQRNSWRDDSGIRGLWMTADTDPDSIAHGTFALTTPHRDATAKPRWLTGHWNDGAQVFWDEFRADGVLHPEVADSRDDPAPAPRVALVGSLAVTERLEPGEERDIEFRMTWHFPNRPRGWDGNVIRDDPHLAETVHNAYATDYADAWHVAVDLDERLPVLEATTRAFVDALYETDLPDVVADAVGSNLVVLRSTTCFVLEGGVFAAWEGSLDRVGSCEGTCTHVWNYAQAAAWLFPELERSARRTEFLLETDDDGRQAFRTNRIFGSPAWDHAPAADGQLGTIIRVYREWLLSGDDDGLAELWPRVRAALDFAFAQWDIDGDLLLDGVQHTTYDIDFVGVNPLTGGLLVAALRAGAALADAVGETDVGERWRSAAATSASRMDALLFTGEYYQQRLDPAEASRYQFGTGVLSDQLFGQFLAHVVGLGHVLPVEHVRSALAAIVRHNVRTGFAEHHSVQRAFALNGESGLVLCSWPNGGRPEMPFVYADEVWPGIEYQVASHLMYEGMLESGLRLVEAVRARHDGVARNPWSEPEFGNHYARSLASWALLLALSGQQYEARSGVMRFDPARRGPQRLLFSTGSAWGIAELGDTAVTLRVEGGDLRVRELWLRDTRTTADQDAAEAGPGETLRFVIGDPDVPHHERLEA